MNSPAALKAVIPAPLLMEELIERSTRIQLVPDQLPTQAVYPVSGLATLPLWIR